MVTQKCVWLILEVALRIDSFTGDMYLGLSFVINAELLPLILKIIFQDFQHVFNYC